MSVKSLSDRADLNTLVEVSNAVQYRSFEETAKKIFETCRKLIDARSGYVALLNKDGKNNDVLFLDSGGLECTVDPTLQMPIRGLRELVYSERRVVYRNGFQDSEWIQYLPTGHVELGNVLFAPLLVQGKVVGLLGLANKPNGFNDDDARIAKAFGDFIAISLILSRTTEALGKSEQKYRHLVENLNEGVWATDDIGNTTFVNRQLADMMGYEMDEMIGRPFFSFIDEYDAEKARRSFENLKSGVKAQLDLTLVRGDGTRVSATMVSSIVVDDEGNFDGSLNGVIDITERKAMEIELQGYASHLEEMVEDKTKQLLDSERSIAISKLTSMLAHDLRNPLNFIVQAIEMMKRQPGKAERLRELIKDNAMRSLRMIEELRESTKEITLNREITDITSLVQNLEEGSLIPDSVKVKLELISGLQLNIDPGILRRVFENLVNNAVDVMPDGGVLAIRVHRGLEYTSIDVADTGPGIPEEAKPRLFELFYTTKRMGLGLGLAFSKRAMEAHGGSLSFTTELGKGTTFTIKLPNQLVQPG